MMPEKKKSFNYQEFLKRADIKEHTLYLVNVSWNSCNPIHEALLFMGFRNGAYCQIYINNYECAYDLSGVHSLEIVKELYTFKK
jgi:hypothetical protein